MEFHDAGLFDRAEALEMLMDCANMGLWEISCEGEGYTIHMDARTSAMFELPAQEQSMALAELLKRCFSEDRSRIEFELAALFANPGMKKNIDYRIWVASQNQWRWVRSYGRACDSGEPGAARVIGSTQDIQDSLAFRLLVDQTNEANERTQIMLDATPLCCNLWDEHYNNIDCNQEAVTLFELSSKQEYLERFFELSPPFQPCGRPTGEMAMEYIRKAFSEGGARFEWMHQKLDGEPIPAEITLVRVKRGEQYIVAGYTRDLREYKKMMAEIREVEADLRLARNAAEESARSKSEFLANMSHEIRTPMNAVLGMLHLIQAESVQNLTFKQVDYLHKIEQSAKTLLRIINDILDFSKIEAGKLEMENVEFSIDTVLKQLSDMFEQQMLSKGLRFEVRATEEIPTRLMGDPLRLTQVLLNLLSNSLKFTEQGGVVLSVLEVARTSDKCQLRFTVKDTGIGMGEEEVKKLFSPFTQADTSTTRKYGGTGLGLAISKKLVNMMHGDIWCESRLGEGTEFCLTAEFGLVAAAAAAARAQADRAESMGEGTKLDTGDLKPILLAEDNEINQLIAKELLTMEGYRVDVAGNGREAVDMLLAGDYELILMDIQMPGMDGIAATREIRALPQYADLPIIAMTAHAMSGDREKSIEAGMNDHITKPIQPELLYETLHKWIAAKHKNDGCAE